MKSIKLKYPKVGEKFYWKDYDGNTACSVKFSFDSGDIECDTE